MSTTTDSPTPATSHPEANAFIGRQAILNEHREVFGYELFDRSVASFTAASDAALLFNALSYAGAEALVGRKLVFINTTHDGLAGGHLELISPEKVILEIPALAEGASAYDIAARCGVFASLKERGFRIAFDQHVLSQSYASWLPLADFIKLDMLGIPAPQLPAVVGFAQAHTKAQVVAEKVETQEQFETMKALGVKLFQGYWFAKPDVVQAKTVRPNQAVIMQLLNLVRNQGSTSEIEDLLKKDPALSFNLLRFINSAGFGLSVEVTSFRHAVMILGLKKLFRWAALLLTTSRGSDTAPAIGQTAVVRGRLMELLATELLPKEETDNAFIVGMFSLLDSMLGIPMAVALEVVSLPQPVRDALLHKTGVFAPFLELTLACETGDDSNFARLAEALHLSNHQVNWAHLQALAWAETFSEMG
ncbi:Cyclic di-GMP phosphodiesterase CdgJ [uncultured Comamonas sp.]|nr:Cyclic di-GMP phosphodiesterase CdgJ [uncultured Comamonas sp.]